MALAVDSDPFNDIFRGCRVSIAQFGALLLYGVSNSKQVTWRDGRAVYCTGLENRRPERVRGFESHSLRQPEFLHNAEVLNRR
jgi:hypothetical protein